MCQKKALQHWLEVQPRTAGEISAFCAGYYRSYQDLATIFDNCHRVLVRDITGVLNADDIYGNGG